MKALPWILAGVTVGAALVLIVLNEPSPQAGTGWDSVENAAGRAWRFGSKTRASGAASNLAGKVKEGFGRLTGDQDLADEGVVDQAVGAVKSGAGTLAHAAGQTLHDLNR